MRVRPAGVAEAAARSVLHARRLDETYRPLFGDSFADGRPAAGARTAGSDRDVLAGPGARTPLAAADDGAALGSADACLWLMEGSARAERFHTEHEFASPDESFPAGGPWTGQETHRTVRTGAA